MNKVILMGRLTKDPVVKTTGSDMKIANFTLAVDRGVKKEGQPSADFIQHVAYGKTAETIEKYLKQGTKIAVIGRITTGSYVNKDGNKVYTTDVTVENFEFADSKNASPKPAQKVSADSFLEVPAGASDELPFN